VPGRTEHQCKSRWYGHLASSIDETTRRTGTWALDEDIKLKYAVQTHGAQNWAAITALVPGRMKNQCKSRWRYALDPCIGRRASGHTGKWTPDEDIKFKDAVQTHRGKNWDKIAALVPDRSNNQCRSRWHNRLDPSIDRTPIERTGQWAEDEDIQLKDSVQMHGGKNWAAITALVPGRAINQCKARWKGVLDPSINRAIGRNYWTEDEDGMLKDAVQTYGGKNWGAIVALVPGRTNSQCNNRCHDVLDPSIDRANGRTDKWTPASTTGRTGKWTEVEDTKLQDAVLAHGGKDWGEIAR
jgi:hypothetical protein